MIRTLFAVASALIFYCAACASMVIAQTTETRNSHIVAVSPIILPLYANLRFWTFIDSNIALGVGIHVPWRMFAVDKLQGYGAMVEPRYYLKQSRGFEWYAAANLSFGFIRHRDTTSAPIALLLAAGVDIYTDDTRHFTIGLATGVGQMWNATRLDAYEGQSYNSDVYSSNGFLFGLLEQRFIPWARFDMGWAW